MSRKIYKGIIMEDCAQTSVYYRDELIKLGIPKDTMKFAIFEKNGCCHVVLILDITEQLFKDLWKLKEIKPSSDMNMPRRK